MSANLFYSASSVEIFYLHVADRTTPFEVTFKALDELYKEGKFVTISVTVYSFSFTMPISCAVSPPCLSSACVPPPLCLSPCSDSPCLPYPHAFPQRLFSNPNRLSLGYSRPAYSIFRPSLELSLSTHCTSRLSPELPQRFTSFPNGLARGCTSIYTRLAEGGCPLT